MLFSVEEASDVVLIRGGWQAHIPGLLGKAERLG
jgi:hypothetical protein